MIVYITGAPGSGKTLWTLRTVAKRAQDEGRKVYYYNIPQVNIPGQDWTELTLEQAKNPHDLPTGSIVVVDEAWDLWPQSKAGVKVPDHIELFATHRHRGHDFYILTQRTTSVHHFIRGLIAQHVHFERQFGLPRSRRFEWQRIGNPSDKWDKDAASSSEFIFPKEVYSWYKSSDQHTVKVKLPWVRLGGIGVLVLFIVGGLWYAFDLMTNLSDLGKKQGDEIANLATAQASANQATAQQLAELEAKIDAANWSSRFVERVPGIPMSASFYDESVKPEAVPRIAGCSRIQLEGRDSCRCTTQQGSTIREITHGQCVKYVRYGWFDPLKPDEADHMPDNGPNRDGGGGGVARADSGAAAAPPPKQTSSQKPVGTMF